MSIVGVGIDVCEVGRFAASLQRAPRLAERLFTPAEREGRSDESLAARFAAKEALAKALRTTGGLGWHDAVVVSDPVTGQPRWEVDGTVAARCAELGVTHLHLSMSHDGGISTAFVVAERV